ncbi:MAG: hypothetical protein JW829_01290 [Pirellulales bacterium]|nr:hypothetical protein [Pirellulales bacterium]
MRYPPARSICLILFVGAILTSSDTCLAAHGGQLTLKAVDSETRQPLAVRIHLQNARGRSIKPRARDAIHHGDHLVIDGETTLTLGRGHYRFEMEAGPEYRVWTGQFEIQDHAEDEKTIEMHRFADLAKEGWYAGDLHVARSNQHMDRLMRAEGLHVVSLIAMQNLSGNFRNVNPWEDRPDGPDPQRWFNSAALLDRRAAGGFLLFQVQPPEFQGRVGMEGPWPLRELRATRGGSRHFDIADPFSWDLPLWLADVEPDTFQLISDHALRNQSTPATSGRPRDPLRYSGSTGTGRWAEAIYYHLLNCGLRIPPSAGSGSGNTSNPVGQNRVYVYCGELGSRSSAVPPSSDDTEAASGYNVWWAALRAGRSFVTNGPLLRANVEGQPPGAVFTMGPGKSREFLIGLALATRDKVEYLQVIKNGAVELEVRLDQWAQAGGRLPPLQFNASGWFLIRAVTNNRQVYQFASTAPYYVESAENPRRISRSSVQFFLEWLQMSPIKLHEDHEIEKVRAFWGDLLNRANAP